MQDNQREKRMQYIEDMQQAYYIKREWERLAIVAGIVLAGIIISL